MSAFARELGNTCPGGTYRSTTTHAVPDKLRACRATSPDPLPFANTRPHQQQAKEFRGNYGIGTSFSPRGKHS